MRGAEQPGGEFGVARFPDLVMAERVAGAGVDDDGERRVLGPGGGGVERGGEQVPAALRVTLREDRQGEPGPRACAKRLPPDHPVTLDRGEHVRACLLYTSDAADDLLCVDL